MKLYLKMKIMSLAAEARIIRTEEKKWPGEHAVRNGLHQHRIRDVRSEARHALLAYGFLRGRDYRRLERKAARAPDWERVQSWPKSSAPPRRQTCRSWRNALPSGGTLPCRRPDVAGAARRRSGSSWLRVIPN
jgi:hypothetical protein